MRDLACNVHTLFCRATPWLMLLVVFVVVVVVEMVLGSRNKRSLHLGLARGFP